MRAILGNPFVGRQLLEMRERVAELALLKLYDRSSMLAPPCRSMTSGSWTRVALTCSRMSETACSAPATSTPPPFW